MLIESKSRLKLKIRLQLLSSKLNKALEAKHKESSLLILALKVKLKKPCLRWRKLFVD